MGSDVLTPERLARLLFATFRYEQGDPALARNVFLWVHSVYPQYSLTRELIDKTRAILTPAVEKKVGVHTTYTDPTLTHQQFGSDRVKQEIDEHFQWLKLVFNNQFDKLEHIFFLPDDYPRNIQPRSIMEWGLHQDYLAFSILQLILFRDAFHTEGEKGCPRRKRPKETAEQGTKIGNPDLDPWTSLFVEYIVRGYPTGSEEMDQLNISMRRLARNYVKNPWFLGYRSAGNAYFGNNVEGIVQLYNLNHPDKLLKVEDI